MQEVPLPVYTAQDEKIARLEALVHRLLGDYYIGATLTGPFPSADSVMGLRHAGSEYFLSNTLNVRPTLTTGTLSANQLNAVPFYVPNIGGVADRIAIEVTTLSAGNARLGIYDSDRNCYPSRLLLDAGVVSTASTGVKAITIRQGLSRGLKWLVQIGNSTPTVRRAESTGVGFWTPLGCAPTTWTFYMEWYVAYNYAALPARFPSGGAKTSWGPLLMLRFAA